ncbi:MAG: trypsin-like peptidase domain-containing protein [Pirellulales bacterium]
MEHTKTRVGWLPCRTFLVVGLLTHLFTPIAAEGGDPQVIAAERHRIEIVRKITPATIAIFDSTGAGGGSGVLISPDGYALTNYHVTAPCGPAMKCGLPDGRLYDAVIVGIDPPGDVALIKLLGRDDFPSAELGDSDRVQMGDWVYVAGNPFLLADDFQPSVSYGIVSGTHRYQYPAGTLLEYADCIQTDAAINPGNSGGPLYDSEGRLIGINGRGSFEKRGRVNVGVGYAISINQIKRFLSHLKSGRVVDHASLGATVTTASDGRPIVDEVMLDSDAYRRGLRYGDELLAFDGRELSSANAFKNALGTYPAGWTVPIEFMSKASLVKARVRLMPQHAEGELDELIAESPPSEGEPEPKRIVADDANKLPPPVAECFEERPGFANYWFNRQHQERLLETCPQRVPGKTELEDLHLAGTDGAGAEVTLQLSSNEASITSEQGRFFARFESLLAEELNPPGSGGLLTSLHLWRMLLEQGPDAVGEVFYMGEIPWHGSTQPINCLVAIHKDVRAHFYFAADTGNLTGMELFTDEALDSCRVTFSDFRLRQGRSWPHEWNVHWGEYEYMTFRLAPDAESTQSR